MNRSDKGDIRMNSSVARSEEAEVTQARGVWRAIKSMKSVQRQEEVDASDGALSDQQLHKKYGTDGVFIINLPFDLDPSV